MRTVTYKIEMADVAPSSEKLKAAFDNGYTACVMAHGLSKPKQCKETTTGTQQAWRDGWNQAYSEKGSSWDVDHDSDT